MKRKGARMIWGGVLFVVVVIAAYVRLAGSDAGRWHRDVARSADADFASGAVRVIDGDAETLARLDRIARTHPRTRVLAGSAADGHVTYVTRSALWGFPDYTTVQQVGDRIRLHARLRFGRSDLGVNRSRLDAWLARLKS